MALEQSIVYLRNREEASVVGKHQQAERGTEVHRDRRGAHRTEPWLGSGCCSRELGTNGGFGERGRSWPDLFIQRTSVIPVSVTHCMMREGKRGPLTNWAKEILTGDVGNRSPR